MYGVDLTGWSDHEIDEWLCGLRAAGVPITAVESPDGECAWRSIDPTRDLYEVLEPYRAGSMTPGASMS